MSNSILSGEDYFSVDNRTGLVVAQQDLIEEDLATSAERNFPGVSVEDGTWFGKVLDFFRTKLVAVVKLASYYANYLNLFQVIGVALDDVAGLFKIRRKEATATRARVTFTGEAGYVVTAGTKITDENGTYVFVTEDDVKINSEGHGIVYAYCSKKGSVQIGKNVLTKLVSADDKIIKIENDEGTTGKDFESDEELRIRVQMQRYTGSSLLESIRSGLLSVDGVESCYCEENDTAQYRPSKLSDVSATNFLGFSVIDPSSYAQYSACAINVYDKLYEGSYSQKTATNGQCVAYRKQTKKTIEIPSGVQSWVKGSKFHVNDLTKVTVSSHDFYYSSKKEFQTSDDSPASETGSADWDVYAGEITTEVEEWESGSTFSIGDLTKVTSDGKGTYYKSKKEFQTSDYSPASEDGAEAWESCDISEDGQRATIACSDDNSDYSLKVYKWNVNVWVVQSDVMMLRPHSIWCCVSGGTSAAIGEMIFRKKSSGSDMNTVYESQQTLGEYDVQVDHFDNVNGISHEIKFSRPQEKTFSVDIAVIKNTYTGEDEELENDVKSAIVSWQNGNVFGVDGLSIGQSIYSYEVGAAVSEKIPPVKIAYATICEIGNEITEHVTLTARCIDITSGEAQPRYVVYGVGMTTTYPVYRDSSTYYLDYDMFLDVSEWESGSNYTKNSLVSVTTNGTTKYYRAKKNMTQSTTSPDQDTTNWTDVTSSKTGKNHFELVQNEVSSSSNGEQSTPIVTFKDISEPDVNSYPGNFVIFGKTRATSGDWSSTTQYYVDSLVDHNDKKYVALKKSKAQSPSAVSSQYWQEITLTENASYTTLQKAIDECADGEIITQLKDVDDTIATTGVSNGVRYDTSSTTLVVKEVETNAGKSVILDMNGHNITVSKMTKLDIQARAALTIYNNKTVLNSTSPGSRAIYNPETVSVNNGFFNIEGKPINVNGTLNVYGATVKTSYVIGTGSLIVSSGYVESSGSINTTSYEQRGGKVRCSYIASYISAISKGYLIATRQDSGDDYLSVFEYQPVITGGYIKGYCSFLSPKTQISGGAVIDVLGGNIMTYKQGTGSSTSGYWTGSATVGQGTMTTTYTLKEAGTVRCIFPDILQVQEFKKSVKNEITGQYTTKTVRAFAYQESIDMSAYFLSCAIKKGTQEGVGNPSSTLAIAVVNGVTNGLLVEKYGNGSLFTDIQIYTSSNIVPDQPVGYANTYKFEIHGSIVSAEDKTYPEPSYGQQNIKILNSSYLTMTTSTTEGSGNILNGTIRRNEFTSPFGQKYDNLDIPLESQAERNNSYSVTTGVTDKTYGESLSILPFQIGKIKESDIGVLVLEE